MKRDLQKALRTIDLLSALPDPLIDQLAAFSMIRTIRAGETIFCQGEPSPYCFGVLSGEVLIQRVSSDRRFAPKALSVLGRGAIFGESSFFEESPRNAMATATKDGELVAILGWKFRDWIRRETSSGVPLLMGMLQNALERLQQTSCDLALVYGVGRLLGTQKTFAERLAESIAFIRNSVPSVDAAVLYQRSLYWDEFEPLAVYPEGQDVASLPVTNALVAHADASGAPFLLKSEAERQSLSAAQLPWQMHSACAVVPLFDRDGDSQPLQGLLLLASQDDVNAFSPNTLLLLASLALQLTEGLGRQRRQEDAEAQSRLHRSRQSFNL
jgi:CRP-like cAMP-binding protein